MKMKESEYISDRLDNQSDWFGRKASENKNRHYMVQLTVITMSAFIPFFTGIDLGLPDYLKEIVIGLMGVSIAVVSGAGSLYKFQDKWTEYRITRELLKREKINFQTRTGLYAKSADPFVLLVQRVEEILSNERDNWKNYIKIAESS